jgi:hypothetical protein
LGKAGTWATNGATHADNLARTPVAKARDPATPLTHCWSTCNLLRNGRQRTWGTFPTAVTSDRAFPACPGAYALTALSSRTEGFLAASDALAIAALGCPSHPRDGSERTTDQGGPQQPKRLAPGEGAAGHTLGQVVEGELCCIVLLVRVGGVVLLECHRASPFCFAPNKAFPYVTERTIAGGGAWCIRPRILNA